MNDFDPQPASPAKQAAILIVIGVVMLAAAVFFVWDYQDEIARGYEGPLKVSTADLLKVRKPWDAGSPWISYQAENVIETEVELVESQAGNKTVEAVFHLVQVGDQWLIAAMPPKFKGNTIVGEISNREWHSLWKEARQQVEQATAEIHGGNLLPYQLHGYIDYGENQKWFLYLMIALGIVGALFLLGGLCAMVSAIRSPQLSPSDFARDLSQTGAWSR